MLFVVDRLTHGLQKKSAAIESRWFRQNLGVSQEFTHEAIAAVEEKGWLKIRRQAHALTQYELVPEAHFEKPRLTLCRDCGQVAYRRPTGGFIPTPHNFLKIFAAASNAAVKCILAIAEQVLDLDKETAKFVVVGGGRNNRPAKLAWSLSDFSEKTGLSPETISQGLREAEQLNVVISEPDSDHPGRRRYTLDLDSFAKLQKRPPRTCRQPKRVADPLPTSEEGAKKNIDPDPEELEKTITLKGYKLTGTSFVGECAACRKEGIGYDVVAVNGESQQSRAGPGPPQARKTPPKEEIPGDLQETFDFLRPWCLPMAALPSVQILREVRDAMQGCPLEWVKVRFGKAADRIQKAGSPRYLISIAQDAGDSWPEEQKRRQQIAIRSESNSTAAMAAAPADEDIRSLIATAKSEGLSNALASRAKTELKNAWHYLNGEFQENWYEPLKREIESTLESCCHVKTSDEHAGFRAWLSRDPPEAQDSDLPYDDLPEVVRSSGLFVSQAGDWSLSVVIAAISRDALRDAWQYLDAWAKEYPHRRNEKEEQQLKREIESTLEHQFLWRTYGHPKYRTPEAHKELKRDQPAIFQAWLRMPERMFIDWLIARRRASRARQRCANTGPSARDSRSRGGADPAPSARAANTTMHAIATSGNG